MLRIGWTGRRLLRPKSPLVRQASRPAWSGVVALAVFRQSWRESLVWRSGSDRIVGQSAQACRLCATTPTSVPFESRCSRSDVFVSFAAPPRLAKPLVCCIDRLNLHPGTVIPIRSSVTGSENARPRHVLRPRHTHDAWDGVGVQFPGRVLNVLLEIFLLHGHSCRFHKR
ncbi:hypothetical protein CBM2629_U30029 [Cupriavidus taiwanensis]|nr:hypothetical protein CBM2629_U30029 [Cupriavidus taiwanensis]